ncbi:uncharacterized protein Z519_03029 [Cladophialophora bantiana CBS 173.52]|uniref:Major facilitator superfamily (MFS) profile domain-containing protein n=1 Tax=Cladophialophora bantiana (strain ATCC 10958 / CBS 173.52 / CDC B-1940 / NIH 8579) TaxID=1442370 RepID=A0A0D2HR77_CLAB1|nr:uncharacterized protein Z519_03029 [Cladophialophora bantiana CBS 173.52]KIW95963.1 hypothetical protein Z519_03029 [Cladophialophora bantiana CBS 173.52]
MSADVTRDSIEIQPGVEKNEIIKLEEVEYRHVDEADAEPQPKFKWTFTVYANLAALYFTYTAGAWAQIVPAFSVIDLQRLWPDQAGLATWVVTSASVAACVLTLFVGNFSDLLGRRYFMIAANSIGIAGCLVASRATSTAMAIGGNAISGVALGLSYLAVPMLAEMVPKVNRGPIIAIAGAMSGIISSAGGVGSAAMQKENVGGIHEGWRPALYMNAGLWFLSLVLVFFFYHPGERPNPEGYTTLQKIKHIDWPGLVLGASGLVMTLLGLAMGGNTAPWNSAKVLVLLIVGLFLLAAFAVWEWKFVPESLGLFRRELFQHRNYALALTMHFIEGASMFTANTFFLQLLINEGFVQTIWTATLYQLPFSAGAMTAACAGGYYLYKTREAKWLTIFSMSVMVAAQALLSVIQPGMNQAAFFVPEVAIAMGVGALGTCVVLIVTLAAPNRYIGHAVALATSIRSLGGAVGLVMFAQVLQSKVKERLVPMFTKAVLEAQLPPTSVVPLLKAMLTGEESVILQVPGVTLATISAATRAIHQAYADSFRYVWWANLPFGVVSIVLACFLKSTRKQMTIEVVSAVKERGPNESTKDGANME